MLRAFWTVLAAAFTLAVITLSMAMNFIFGYSLGSSELNARMLGALSVACDGLKSLLPLFIAWQFTDRHVLAASVALLLFALLLAYGTASAIGFAAENRGELTGRRDHLNSALQTLATDLLAAEARFAALPAHRLGGVIEAQSAALRLDRLWGATKACTQATLLPSREFCQRFQILRSELAVAAEALVLAADIERLKSEINRTRIAGAGKDSDPQTRAISHLIGLDAAHVRSALAWLLAVAVEAISAFGLFAVT